ncbi:MAG: type II toxin-antitoxin system RelE/ParE family toxin [Treponema sp.]|nr:type II toxin-antitoxin system RelE/ParE family toxin [Treponema sp.]
MNNSSYTFNKMAWEVESTDEYDAWFLEQTENGQASIRMKVELLVEYGPNLPRPHADTLKGSKMGNLKELRTQTENHVFRVVFIFDEERKAVLLIGGDKKGKNEKRFYRNLIKQAEEIYEAYRSR